MGLLGHTVVRQDDGLRLREHEFAKISKLAYEHLGLDLHAGKQGLVSARLSKKIRQLGLHSFQEYYDHVLADASGEALVQRLTAHLEPGGYLLIGHSENLNTMEHGLDYVEPATYRKPMCGSGARKGAR